MYIKEVGAIGRVEALFFVTRTSDGIERTWCSDGSLKEENMIPIEQMREFKFPKVLIKGEFIS